MMQRVSVRARLLVLKYSAVFAALGSWPVLVHSAEDTDADSIAALPEVQVTARKITERLQDVPMSITAVTASDMVNRNQLRLEDFFRDIPGLQLQAIDSGQSNLSIRGVNSETGSNPTVGVVIDDIAYGSSSQFGFGGVLQPDLDPADLQRIEVLKGPQGTLYGASSLGGLVKYVTVDPSTAGFSGKMQLDGSGMANGDASYGVRGSVNIPLISDALAVRLSGFTRRDGGFIDDPAQGRDNVNRNYSHGGRASALWTINDRATLKVGALYQRNHTPGSAVVNTNSGFVPFVGDLRQDSLIGTGDTAITAQLYSGNLTVNLTNDLTLTVLSGLGINHYRTTDDSQQPIYGEASGVGAPENNRIRTRRFSQEVRLGSQNGEIFDWLVGLYYTRERTATDYTLNSIDPATGAAVPACGFDENFTCFVDPDTGVPFFSDLFLREAYKFKYSDRAAFGTVTVKFTDRFDTQLGARYSKNRETYDDQYSGSLTFDEVITNTTRAKDHSFTFLVSPRFKITPDLMAYARIASGYRPGGPNTALTETTPESFKADKTINYELGLKGSLFERKLSFDVAGYYIDWKDIQLSQVDEIGFVFLDNAGKASSKGAEFSVQLRPISPLNLFVNGSYTDAKLKDDLPQAATGGTYGVSGDRLPASPHFAGALGAEYEFPLGTANFKGVVGSSMDYISSRRGEFAPGVGQVRLNIPGYTTFDLNTGIRAADWNVSVFVTNVSDRRGILYSTLAGLEATPDSTYRTTYIRPRTVGLSVSKDF